MAHEIYDNRFVGVTPAWHRLGKPLAAGTTWEQGMLEAGQTGWDVRILPVEIPGVDGKGLHIIVRNDGDAVVVASETLVNADYLPISNEEVFGPMVSMLTGINMPVDAAGVLGRLGNRAFVTFDAGAIEVAGGEKYLRFLIALANHTGRDAVRILPSGIRVVCANTEAMALSSAKAIISIAHNRAALDAFYHNAESARAVLNLSHNYNVALERMASDMQSVPFDSLHWNRAVDRHVKSLDKPTTARSASYRDGMVARMFGAWEAEMANASTLGQPRTTLWTAKQAVTNYAQHAARGGQRMRDLRSMRLALGETVPMVSAMNTAVADVVRQDMGPYVSWGAAEKALSWMGVGA